MPLERPQGHLNFKVLHPCAPFKFSCHCDGHLGLCRSFTTPKGTSFKGGSPPRAVAYDCCCSGRVPPLHPSGDVQHPRGQGRGKLQFSNLKTMHASIISEPSRHWRAPVPNVLENMPAVAAANPGIVKFVFGALFPVCLVLVLNMVRALQATLHPWHQPLRGKISLRDVAKSWTLAFIGTSSAAVCSRWPLHRPSGSQSNGGGIGVAKATVAPSGTVKGIFCNYLVCMAVYLATMARDMTGRYFGILVPIPHSSQRGTSIVWQISRFFQQQCRGAPHPYVMCSSRICCP